MYSFQPLLCIFILNLDYFKFFSLYLKSEHKPYYLCPSNIINSYDPKITCIFGVLEMNL